MTEPYHRYVFDEKNRKPVLQFEEMYKAEDIKNFDSWHQENTISFGKQLALAILNQYNWDKILDIGCGKGCFTHLLKKDNNFVVGIDISKTAIEKASVKYPNVCFKRTMFPDEFDDVTHYDLVVMMEALSYIENWKFAIERIASFGDYCFLSLYLPSKPIGFIKNFNELKTEIGKYFTIEREVTEIHDNCKRMMILARNNKLLMECLSAKKIN
ncbi:MAG: class I SAM-dependent methyltransferase [Thermoplasmatales archaeon]|nr:class I SAM-dependent methyltransferase [Thermoplasmatales archaeon]